MRKPSGLSECPPGVWIEEVIVAPLFAVVAIIQLVGRPSADIAGDGAALLHVDLLRSPCDRNAVKANVPPQSRCRCGCMTRRHQPEVGAGSPTVRRVVAFPMNRPTAAPLIGWSFEVTAVLRAGDC